MKRLTLGLAILSVIAATVNAERTVVDYAEDATANIQAALDKALTSDEPITVVVPYGGRTWYTNPLAVHSNTTLELRPGVILHAKRKSFYGKSDSLLTIRDVSNVTVKGFGAVMRGWGREWTDTCRYEHSEWRHGINVKSSARVTIRGLTIENFCSGIAIGNIPGNTTPSSAIRIENVTCRDNQREGLFACSVIGLYVANSTFKSTAGHNTQAGVDLEPNRATDRLLGVYFVNCKMTGNNGPGFGAWLHKLSPTSERVDIRYVNCLSRDNRKASPIFSAVNGLPPGSIVECVDCTFWDDEWTDTYEGAVFRNCQRVLATSTVEEARR